VIGHVCWFVNMAAEVISQKDKSVFMKFDINL